MAVDTFGAPKNNGKLPNDHYWNISEQNRPMGDEQTRQANNVKSLSRNHFLPVELAPSVSANDGRRAKASKNCRQKRREGGKGGMMSGKRADRRAADQWHTRQANHDDEDGCERRTHIHIRPFCYKTFGDETR